MASRFKESLGFVKKMRVESVTELESNLKPMFCKYIKEHFPLDENSVGILNQQMDFREFLSCLLDYMEKKGL